MSLILAKMMRVNLIITITRLTSLINQMNFVINITIVITKIKFITITITITTITITTITIMERPQVNQ